MQGHSVCLQSARKYCQEGSMAIAPDTKTALVALNRFGFGARGGNSGFSRVQLPIHAGS